MLGLDEYGQPGNFNSLVLGAAAGLVVGLAAGFVLELAARLVLLPFFGRALWRAPLLAMQLFDDSDSVAGLKAKPDRGAQRLGLTFWNDEIAGEFERLNTGQGGS